MLIKPEILVIEDEADIRNLIEGVLQDEGYPTRSASNSSDGLKLFDERCPKLVILDIWLGDNERDGLNLLEHMRQMHPLLPIVMISGHATIEKAVQSIRLGAYDFLEKPFQMDKLIIVVKRALETVYLQQQVQGLKVDDLTKVLLAGDSVHVTKLRGLVDTYAMKKGPVFISGPLGSGHFYCAKALHECSLRRLSDLHMVAVSGIDQMHIDHHFFGFEIMGENSNKKTGLLEYAHLSAIFIDEVTLLPHHVQKNLCDYIKTGEFKRVGGKQVLSSNVRLIFGTQKSESELTLLPDLRAILLQQCIQLKDLRSRFIDIVPMAQLIVENYCRSLGMVSKQFSKDLEHVLENSYWSANLLQLKILCQWMVLMGRSDASLEVRHLPQEFFIQENYRAFFQLSMKDARESFEREFIEYHLRRHAHNVSTVAEKIGMDRTALHRKIKSLQVLDE